MATSVATGSRNSAGGGSYCRAAAPSNRTANDGTTHSAAPCGTLCHDIREGHRNSEQQQNGHGEGAKHLKLP